MSCFGISFKSKQKWAINADLASHTFLVSSMTVEISKAYVKANQHDGPFLARFHRHCEVGTSRTTLFDAQQLLTYQIGSLSHHIFYFMLALDASSQPHIECDLTWGVEGGRARCLSLLSQIRLTCVLDAYSINKTGKYESLAHLSVNFSFTLATQMAIEFLV